MKTNCILQTLVMLFFVFTATAQQGINYKAIINDANGDALANTTIAVQFTILENGTTNVFQETHSPTTDGNGIIIVTIGEGTLISGDYSAIDWGGNPHFLKTEIDSGDGLTDMGTTEFKTVPYALYANTAAEASEIDPVFTPSEAANITATDITNLSNLSGTNTGDQDLSNVLSQGTNAGENNITNLLDPVSDQDAVTKAYVDALIEQLYAQGALRVRDYDGNYYNTIKIGNQIWMAENLKTTKYNDGTDISLVTDNIAWGNLTTPGYCWYNNDEAAYGDTYGALYNWYTVETGDLCPAGWHVPTDAEWTTLTDYLGGTSVAGGKLKETGTTHWLSPNTGATNESGFTALPGSFRDYYGSFYSVGYYAGFWAATENSSSNAWSRSLYWEHSDVFRYSLDKYNGFSARCVRDY